MSQLQKAILFEKSQIGPASQMLARAFHDDPMATYVVPDDLKRPETMSAFFEVALRYGLSSGEIYTSDEVTGAAIWINPAATSLSLVSALKAGLLGSVVKGFLKFGPAAFGRLLNVGETTEKWHQQYASGPHYYLLVLGVDPPNQGQGQG